MALMSDLYIFSDNAKGSHDENAVQEVRNFIKTIDDFKSITIYEADKKKDQPPQLLKEFHMY